MIDLQTLPRLEREAEVDRLATEEARQPFDLARGPLMRASSLRLGAEDHVLLLTIHHIVTDGWSMQVFIREMIAIYAAFSAGKPSPLPELPIQYADFACWQRAWLQGAVLEAQLAYWRQQLSGSPPMLDLPTDRSRPAVQTFRGAAQSFKLAQGLSEALKALSQRKDATLFMTLLAAFNALLYRYTGQGDISVGSPIAGRTRAETEGLIGFFANTLVLRTNLSGNPTFHELLGRIREVAVGAYGHQDLPFEHLVEELQPERDMSRNPLFQVMFVLQNTPPAALELPGLTFSPIKFDAGTAKFDLWLAIIEGAEQLGGTLEYNTDLFDDSTITRMLGHFQALLHSIVAHPDRTLAALPLLADVERQQLLVAWNDTAIDYPLDQCLHHLIEAQVARAPDTVAVVFDGPTTEDRGWRMEDGGPRATDPRSSILDPRCLTYHELNAHANQLAHTLHRMGVGPEVRVGICMERSLDLVVGLLGILKAGGAYVPLDPTYPQERLAFMLADAGVPVLLVQRHLLARWPDIAGQRPTTNDAGPTTHDERQEAREVPIQHPTSNIQHPIVVCLDCEWERIGQESAVNPVTRVMADNLAYVIYTSGSTGTPKGAMVPHRGICNRLLWMQDAYGLTADDRVLQKTPFSFDVSVWEFFWPLLASAQLVVARPEGHKDPAYLVKLIAEQAITTLHFVPSMLRLFLEEHDLAACCCLRRVICSGEALPIALQDRFFARLNAALHNLYGPTEASVDVTAWACERAGTRRTVPIGRPIANTRIHLLDAHLQPAPIGVPGELYIGGVQLARGYLGRPDLTAERFVPKPFAEVTGDGCWVLEDSAPNTQHPTPNTRLYRTGDLARYHPDGSIEYLGRIDHQVKLRGFRIELGEIETTLRRHPALRDTVVMVREDTPGDTRLVAYVVPGSPRDGLEEQLVAAALPPEHVGQWRMVFDETYRQTAPDHDPTFNIVGWNSSYTGEPIPAEEMREWVDQTVARIRSLRPRRVLEIGCGTGLLLFRIAPGCAHYCGTDFSRTALEYLQRQSMVPGQEIPHVTLLERPADDFTGIAAQTADVVILNSVVQYFPDIDYLVRVLEGAVTAVTPGGCIFVGDVRSLPLLEVFHTAVELHRAPDTLSTAGLRQRARKRMAQEEELVIDPAFFVALAQHLPQISQVAIQLKRGRHHNELTRFRYDVLLHVGPQERPTVTIPWLDWRQAGLTLARIRQLLVETEPHGLGIARVPDARLQADVRTLELLAGPDQPETVTDLRQVLQAIGPDGGVDPEDMWALGDELPYAVDIRWSGAGIGGCYDVVLRRRMAWEAQDGTAPFITPPPAFLDPDIPRPWDSYANHPLQEKLARMLIPALRSYLKEKLPDYMVPSAFELLPALPLTPSGKVDRRALPAPVQPMLDLEGDVVAPRTPVEQLLAEIWAQVLVLEQVGINNNFFALGGDSIHSIQVIARANQAGLRLTLKQLFQHQTIAELAAIADTTPVAAPEQRPPMAPFSLAQLDRQTLDQIVGAGRQIMDMYPLSPLQEHMLRCYLSTPESGLYVVQRLIAWPGQLNVSALERSWQQVTDRHPFLRTSFVWEGLDRPLQAVHEGVSVRIEQQDWRGLSPAGQEERVAAYIATDRKRGFDITQPSTMRVLVAQLAEDRYYVVPTSHYMRLDGWSYSLVMSDLFAFYEAACRGQDLHLERIPRPYTDYIAWIQQQDLAAVEAFWRQMLAGVTAPTPLMERAPHNRPGREGGFKRQDIYLPPPTSARLQSLAQQHRLTLSTLVQGAWALLLSHYSGADNVVFGYMVSGRPATLIGVETMVGPFANVLPLRVRVPREAALLSWLKTLKAQQIELSQYEHTSLRKIHEWSDVPEHLPLFESYLAFQNLPTFDSTGKTLERSRSAEQANAFWAQMEHPLRLDVFPGAELAVVMSYYRRFFDDTRIARMLADIQTVLASMVASPDQQLATVLRMVE